MPDFEIDHKRIKHFNEPGHAHLLTFSCYQHLPLLNDDRRRDAFSRVLDRALERHQFRLVAFVYMPEHVHLLVHPALDEYSISRLLYAIKKPFSDYMKKVLQDSQSQHLQALRVLERPGKCVFRYWQEGPGHDRNLLTVDKCVRAAEYLHNNPVRRGLANGPDQWRWSSWRFYYQENFADPALPRIHGFPA
ncbi:MAG TPA: transposase [Planctomycetota bacterium]|jgi:putative transposase